MISKSHSRFHFLVVALLFFFAVVSGTGRAQTVDCVFFPGNCDPSNDTVLQGSGILLDANTDGPDAATQENPGDQSIVLDAGTDILLQADDDITITTTGQGGAPTTSLLTQIQSLT